MSAVDREASVNMIPGKLRTSAERQHDNRPRKAAKKPSPHHVARNLAKAIDGILAGPRPRERRIELIQHYLRRALSHGCRPGLGRAPAGLEHDANPGKEA